MVGARRRRRTSPHPQRQRAGEVLRPKGRLPYPIRRRTLHLVKRFLIGVVTGVVIARFRPTPPFVQPGGAGATRLWRANLQRRIHVVAGSLGCGPRESRSPPDFSPRPVNGGASAVAQRRSMWRGSAGQPAGCGGRAASHQQLTGSRPVHAVRGGAARDLSRLAIALSRPSPIIDPCRPVPVRLRTWGSCAARFFGSRFRRDRHRAAGSGQFSSSRSPSFGDHAARRHGDHSRVGLIGSNPDRRQNWLPGGRPRSPPRRGAGGHRGRFRCRRAPHLGSPQES